MAMCHCGAIVDLMLTPFEPEAHGVPLPDTEIRLATADDLVDCARLAARRELGDPDVWALQFRRRLADPRQRLMVAIHRGATAGFAWVAHLTPEADGGHGAPDGWYLSGVVVASEYRRRGLGQRLTQARVEWVLGRASEVFYVVSAHNSASRRLHEAVGFWELTRDFRLPGTVFGDGDGILCRLGRERPAAEVVALTSHLEDANAR